MMETYAEYGAIGVIVFLFIMMIMNLIKSQKMQNEDLDAIRQANAKLETKMGNVESIVLKMLDRWNKSDDTSQRHREDIVKELKQDLQTHSKNLKDKVVKIKMNEAIKSIDKFCGLNDNSKIVKDEYVVQTMRYLELLKEVKKSGNKKQKVI